jgi:hypothetical protein
VQVFDAQGILLKNQRTMAMVGANEVHLNSLNLPSGTYLILVKLGNSIAHKTVVK